MRRQQRGFGLGLSGNLFDNGIVLLIMLAIAGFVGWTAYSDYRGRKDVAAGVALAAEARAAVEKAFASKGPADFSTAAGWTTAAPTDVVRSITIEKSGAITVRYTERVADKGHQELQIVPVADGKPLDLSNPASKGRKFTWECGGSAGKTTVPEKLRGVCR
jgi:hypothetical protein